MKTRQRRIRFLEAKEVDTIIEGINPIGVRNLRDRALIEVLFSTGMRISEALALTRDEMVPMLDEDGTSELPIIGKGGWQRVVFFSPRCKAAIAAYLELLAQNERGEGEDADRLFPVTVRAVQVMVAKRSDWVGIKQRVTPHMFRHSLATDLLRKGVDISHVSKFLGHRNIANTMIYAHIVNKDLHDIHKKLYV